MAGFQLPVSQFTPQMLAEMAKASFRPPALMGVSMGGMGGGGGMQMPQDQGSSVGQGIAGMGQGLGMLAGALGKEWGGSTADPTATALYGSPSSVVPSPTVYGGPRAAGGPVTPGQYYTVGEQGPETFVPDVPGYIVPRDFFGGRFRR